MLLDSTVEISPDGKADIKLNGGLTLGSSLSFLEAQIKKAIEGGVRDLHIDMTGLEYTDSAGLGLLVHTYGLLAARQGTMRLTGVQPRVMKMLQMTKLDTLLSVEAAGQQV